MRTSARCSFAVVAVILATAFMPPAARAGEKVLGFGGTGAWGVLFVFSSGSAGVGFDYDGSFEFRLHPMDNFSLDFNFDISTPASTSGLAGEFKVFAHFHSDPYADKYFAFAPYIGAVGVNTGWVGTAAWGSAFLAGCRIGGEIHSPNHDFAFGIYGRPGISAGNAGFGIGVVAELTWIVYPPIPRP